MEDENFKLRRELAASRVELAALRAATRGNGSNAKPMAPTSSESSDAAPLPTTSPPHVLCRVTKDGSPHLGARFGVDEAPLLDAPSAFSPLPPHPPHGDASPPSNGHSPPGLGTQQFSPNKLNNSVESSLLGEEPSPSRSAPSHAATQQRAPSFDFDTANHPSTSPPSIAPHGGAASPQQKRAPTWGLPTTSVHRTLPAPPTTAQLDNMIQVRTLQGRSSLEGSSQSIPSERNHEACVNGLWAPHNLASLSALIPDTHSRSSGRVAGGGGAHLDSTLSRAPLISSGTPLPPLSTTSARGRASLRT